jgi:hypothetical protein
VRTLRKKRVDGDPNKLEEFTAATTALAQAHRFFMQLSTLGEAVTHITPKRLETHIAFCADTHQKASGYMDLVGDPGQVEVEIGFKLAGCIAIPVKG